MRKNFTQLISGLTQTKKYVIALTSLMILAGSVYLMAGITPGSSTPINVSADYAVDAVTPTHNTGLLISDIVIAEDNNMQFSGGTNGFITLNSPTNWVFDVNSNITLSVSGDRSQNIIDTLVQPISANSIRININQTNTNRIDILTIRGIRVRPVVGSLSQGTVGNITYTGSDPNVVTGLSNGTTLARLQKVHGTASKLAFTRQPGNALINANLNPQPQVTIQDQFGNTVTTGDAASASITLALGNNAGGGTLGGNTNLTATNGLAIASGIRLDKAGAGYTLVATSAGLTGTTSNAFTISNRKPVVSSVSPCLSEGDAATELTIAGTNFADGASVFVNGVERTATLLSTSSLRTTLTAEELSEPGNLQIIVKNVLSPESQNNGESDPFSATVLPVLSADNISGTSVVCGNSAGVSYSIPAVTGAKSYIWTVTGDATITAAGSSSNSITVNFGNTSGVARLAVRVLNQCDKAGPEKTFDITINALPVVTLEPFGAVCKNTPAFALTGGSPVGGTYSIGGEAITAFDPATAAVGNHTITYTYQDPATNCVNTATQIIKVNAVPIAKINDGDGEDYFCPNSSATLLASSGPGYGYTWYRVVEGGADIQVGTDAQSFVTNEVGYYYVVVNDGNNCSSTSTPTFVQQSILNYNIISGAQEVCYGAVPGTLQGSKATSDVGNVTYQWQVSSDGVAYSNVTSTQSGGTATLQDLSLTTALTQNRWYRRIARVGSSCSITSQPIEVKVKQQIANTLTSGNQTICLNSPAQPITGDAVTGGDGPDSYSYTWYQRTGAGEWEIATGTHNQESYTPQVSATAGTYYFRREVVSGNCTPVASNAVTVVVQPAIAGNVIGGTDTYCLIATATNLGTVGGTLSGGAGSGFTYTWQVKAGEAGSWQTIENATASTYRPLTTTAGEFFYKRIVASGACSGAESNEFKVTIQPGIVNELAGPASYSYCQNAVATAIGGSVSGGDGVNYTYLWQRSSSGTGSWTTAAGISDQPTYTPATTTTGTVYYRRLVSSGACSTGIASNVVSVTTNTLPASTISIASGSLKLCDGGSVTLRAPAVSGQTYNYQWYVNNTAITENGNARDYIARTSGNYTVRVTNTATECNTTTATATTVTVDPLPAKPTITNLRPIVYTADDPIAMQVSPASATGGTFTTRNAAGTIVSTSSTFSPCILKAGIFTVTYTYSNGTCSNTSDPITVEIKTTTFTAVNFAHPFPICKGQNTEFRAMLYRDVIVVPVTDTRHPDHGQWLNETYEIRKSDPKRYWQDFVGVEPLDANGKLQPAPASLIMNQEDLNAGNEFKDYKFKYQWYRNSNGIGSGRVTAKSAGLSATDEFYVLISPNVATNLPCNTSTSAIRSNSMWLSAPTNYSMTLSAQNPICKGDGVKLVATPNVGFDFSSINLEVNFYIKKAGASAESEPTRLNPQPITTPDTKTNPNDPTTYSYDVAPGIIENGDVVSIFFSTDVVKCLTSGDAGSFMTMIVNERPAIATQPTAQTVCAGTTATLSVGATGAALTYQWYKRPANNPGGAGTAVANGDRVAGATSASLSIANATASDAGLYYVVVGGFCPPTEQSVNVELIVNPVTVMTLQPESNVICPGTNHTFSASATGTSVSYQWYKDGVLIPGAVSQNYTVSDASAEDAGDYTVRVIGTCGELTSEIAKLVINEQPAIVTQPTASTVCEGSTASFGVAAIGTGLTYQWQKNGENIANATASTLDLNNVTIDDAGEYTVIVSGTCSPAVKSVVASLTVDTAPQITTAPEGQEVCAGQENVTFSVAATGTNLAYQWYHDGNLIQGAVGATYTVPVASSATAGKYTVNVSGTCIPELVSEATLIVNSLPTVTVSSTDACVGEIVTVTAEAANGSGNYTYTWIVPSGVTNPGNVASFQTDVAGVYTVLVKDNKACSAAQAVGSTVTFTPKLTPYLGEILAANEKGLITTNNPIAVGDRVIFSLTSEVIDKGAIAAYKWYLGDGSAAGWVLQTDVTGNTLLMDPVEDKAFAVKCEIYPGEGNCYVMQTLYRQEIVPLPVELLYFNASKRGSDVVLDWATASEQDNKGFEVQVSSDARNFRALGFVESRVNTTSLKQVYTFVDKENGKQGTRYYRLKQVDLDGKFEYFIIKAVSFGSVEANKVKAYPNPFQSEVELSIDAELDGDLLITVTNATGQQLLQRTVQVARGTNTEKLVLDPNLPRGVYIISTRMGDFNSHFKLLKQ